MRTKARHFIEALEARIAPATLDLSSGVLTFTAAGNIGNDVTLSTGVMPSGPFAGQSAILIASVGDAMTLTGSAGGVAVGSGSSLVVPAAVVTSIDIDLGDRNDTMTVVNGGGGPVFKPLNIDGGTEADEITFAGTVIVPGALTTKARTTNVVGAVQASGNVSFAADTMAVNTTTGSILGNGDVSIRAMDTSRDVTLGTEVAGTLSLTAAELERIVAAGELTLGSRLNTGSALNVTAALNLTAIGSLNLEAGTGGVAQEKGAPLTVSNLAVDTTAGSVTLDDVANDVSTFAARVTAVARPITFINADGFTIGSVAGLDGVSSNGGAITLQTENGNLSVQGVAVDADAGSAVLRAGSSGGGASLLLSSLSSVEGTAGVTLIGDVMTLSSLASVNAGTADATVRPFTNGRVIQLGAANAAGVMALDSNELDIFAAGDLVIGSNQAGGITIASAIAPAGVTELNLITGGGISDGASGTISENILDLTAVGDITLDNDHSVTALSASGGGSIIYNEGVGAIALTGITATGSGASEIRISAGNLNVLGAVSHTNKGAITLEADAMSISGDITSPEGIVTLKTQTGATAINLGTASGGLDLTDAELDAVSAGTLRIGTADTSFTGGITVSSAISISAAKTLRLSLLAGGGNISDNGAAGSIQATLLRTLSTGPTTLNGANSVTALAGEVLGTTSSDNFSFNETGGFSIGTVDGASGITTSTDTLGVTTSLFSGAGVTQTAPLIGRNLILGGSGPFTLADPGNQMLGINGIVADAVSYTDADDLLIPSVGTTGLATTNSPIAIATINGDLTVQNFAIGADLNAGTSTVSLTAGGAGNTVTINTSANVAGTGGVTITADAMTFNGTVNGGSKITIRTATPGRGVALGGIGLLTLDLSAAELDQLTASTIEIGQQNVGGGAISVAGAIAPANADTLHLFSGGTITGSGGITETTLVLASLAGVSLTGNSVGALAVNGFGDVVFSNGGSALTIATPFNTNSLTTGATHAIDLTAGSVNLPAGRSISNASGGAIVLHANSMNLDGTITTTGRVTLQPTASARTINLGTATGGLDLTDAELDGITAGTLQIGSESTSFDGDIQVSSVISLDQAKVPTLALLTGGGSIGTSGGEIRAAELRTLSSGATTLTGANQVSKLAAEVLGTAAGADFRFTDLNGFSIGTVDGVSGIAASPDTPNGRFTLQTLAVNAGISQVADTNLIGRNLVLDVQGSVTLNSTGNQMRSISGTAGGAVSYTNQGDLLTGAFTNGLSTSNQPLTLTTLNGNLTVQANGNAPHIDAGTSTVSLIAGGSGSVLTIASGASVNGTGGVTFTADDMAINGTVVGGTTATLRPVNPGSRPITLGATVADTLSLEDAELDRITTTRLIVGELTGKSLTVAGAISPAGTNFLSLRSGSDIVDGNGVGIDITVANLSLQAESGIGSGEALDLSVTALEARTGNGGINLNTGAVTFGGVTSEIFGVSAGIGNVVLTSSGTITLAEDITADTGGNVTLVANGASSDLVATVDGARVFAAGTLSITTGRDILLGTGGAGFENDLVAGPLITLDAGRNITLAGDADADATDIVATTGAGGLLTLSGTAEFTGLNSVTLNADRLAVSSDIFVSNGTLAIRPATPGRAVNLGSTVDTTAGTLEISNAELALFTADNVVIGADDSGNVTFSVAITTNDLFEVRSGGTIANSFTGTAFTGPLLRIASGTLAPGGNGIFAVAADFAFGPDATFAPSIGGTTPGTGFDQLVVTGTVDLGGAAFAPVVTFTPAAGTLFQLIDNDTADGITGTFDGLAQGKVIETPDGDFLALNYAGGSGNDFVVKALVPVAPTISLNGKTATYFDEDGDKVTVKTTKGTFTAANFLFRPTSDTGLQQLRLLDLTVGADFTGANITITAKQTAGVGDKLANVGFIDGTGKALGAVSVAGDLGQFDAASAKGLTVQSLGLFDVATQQPGGSLNSDVGGALRKLTVKGDVAGDLTAGSIGKVKVGGDFNNGSLKATSSIAGLTVVGEVDDVVVSAGTGIGAITAKAGLSRSTIGADGSIGNVKVTGDLGGSVIRAGTTLGAVSVSGDVIRSDFSAFGKALAPAKGKDLAIKSLTVGGNVEDTRVFAGYDRNGVGLNRDAAIGAILVRGSWFASSVLAGVEVGTDGFAGTADDVSIAGVGVRDNPNIVSQIASITIKGQAFGTAAPGDHFGVVAEQIIAAKVGGTKFALTKGPRSPGDVLTIGGEGSDFIIREVTA